MEVYKLDGGGMVGIDSSFIEQELPVYSPFDKTLPTNLPLVVVMV